MVSLVTPESPVHGILDLPDVLVRWALALLVPRAPPESTAKMATSATTVRRVLQALLVQMAMTVTLGQRVIKVIRARRGT